MQIVKITVPFAIGSKIFRVNEEYELTAVIKKLEGCGCNGQKKKEVTYYQVTIDGKVYDIRYNYAVLINQSMVKNTMSPEQYHSSLRGTLYTNEGTNYDPIRNKPNPDAIMASANNIPM